MFINDKYFQNAFILNFHINIEIKIKENDYIFNKKYHSIEVLLLKQLKIFDFKVRMK